MLKNYFKTAFRNLKANKFYSIVNISGLGVGLATGIMLLLWVKNEFSYNRFNRKYKNIYQVNSHITFLEGKSLAWQGVPGPLSVMAKEIPGVISVLRLVTDDENPTLSEKVLSNGDQTRVFDDNSIVYADGNFLSFFNYKLLHGNRDAFLPNAHAVALTQSTAKKLFGTEDAIGKIVRFDKNSFTVTAVLQDFPHNSSLQYDAIFPVDYYAHQFTAKGGNHGWKTIDEDINDYSFRTFLLLNSNANTSNIETKLTHLFNAPGNGQAPTAFQLQNLGNLHLIGIDGNNSALQMVRIMALVAILILIIASINYVNLSTARALTRIKEISIKKIIGAKRRQLFLQFITETVLTFMFAIIIAIALIVLLKPLYDRITGEQLILSLSNFSMLEIWFFTLLGTTLISSIYPAMLLSSFKPLGAVRDKSFLGIKTSSFRKSLVVLQFVISFILLVGTIVMGKQMEYISNKDLGYDKNYVFTVPFPEEATKNAAIENELLLQKGILNVSFSSTRDITNVTEISGDIIWDGKKDNVPFMLWRVQADKNFIPTMKYQFIAGTNFTGTPSDDNKYILNETAVKAMGLKPPYVGTKIGYGNADGEILGVVKDFNFKSLKDPVAPLIIRTSGLKNILYVRTTGAGAQSAIKAVESQYKKYANDAPFFYDFLDKTFESHYQSQQRTGTLFTTFAAIAIFISCLGLFGLATYTAQVKTKEIGIRKVLGASVGSVVQLISKDFLKLVIIATVIATPLAYWSMNKWLRGFAYRINISWWMFTLAVAVIMLIALITVSFQSIKAAIANPVKSLRKE